MTTLLQELKLAQQEQIKVTLFIEGNVPYDDVIIKSIGRNTITFVCAYRDNKNKVTKLEQTTINKNMINGISYVIATVDSVDNNNDEDGWIMLLDDDM